MIFDLYLYLGRRACLPFDVGFKDIEKTSIATNLKKCKFS
jgi:hypothetical protein